MHKYFLLKKNLIVITNSLPVIYQLSGHPEIKTVSIGGEIDTQRKASFGPVAVKSVGEYHVNKAFIGSDGFSMKNGLSSYETKESEVTHKMALNADEIFLVILSEKLEKDAYKRFVPAEMIDHLLTDNGITEDLKQRYRKKIDLVII